jgi:hypothetical protein
VAQPKVQREGSGQGVLYERILKAIPSAFSPIPTQGRGMQFGQRCSKKKGQVKQPPAKSAAIFAANDCAIDWYFYFARKAEDATKGALVSLRLYSVLRVTQKAFLKIISINPELL